MFERTFHVPYYGLAPNGRLKSGELLQFFQEAAALHADSVGIGVSDLLPHGRTWVLRRYRVQVNRWPGLGDLTVRTWFEPQRNLVSVRRFSLHDETGAALADAWSGWIVVDLEKGRPVRLDRALPDAYFAATDPTGEPLDAAIDAVGEEADRTCEFQVRWHELDLNGHTNHTVYFDWAIESLPDDILLRRVPTMFDAEYLASAKREDIVVRTRKISEEADSAVRFAHSVVIRRSGTEAARLATTWEAPGASR